MKKSAAIFSLIRRFFLARAFHKPSLLIPLLVFSSINFLGQNFSLAWANSFGGADQDNEKTQCTDSCGNIYVSGVFRGTVDFDPGPSTYTLSTSQQPANAYNAYVAKYDALGSLLWIKQFEGSWGSIQSIRLDPLGNIGFAGAFNYIVDIDPTSTVYSVGSSGSISQQVYVKLNPLGNLVFGFVLGDGFNAAILRFDTNGDLLISGCFQGVLDLDIGPGTNTVISDGGSRDFFICKYTSVGNFAWGAKWGASDFDIVRDLTFDHSGNILACGGFGGTIDFDPSPSTYTLSWSTGSCFILKLNSFGAFIWAGNIGGPSLNGSWGIYADNNNNIYLTGQFAGTVDLDPSAATFSLLSNGGADFFVVKLTSMGSFSWGIQIGGPGDDVGIDISTDSNNNIFITGIFQQTVDFDPGISVTNLVAFGASDGFLLELDNSGNFLKVFQLGGSSKTCPMEISLHGSGSIWLSGYFSGTTDFDPSSAVLNRTSIGNDDVFILKLTPCIDAPAWNCEPPIHECAGSSATLIPLGGNNLNWFLPTSTVNIFTGPVYITPTLAPGTYTFFAEAGTCTLTNNRATFVVTVSPLPPLLINPSSVTVCVGDKVVLTGFGADIYKWNGSNIPQSSTFTLTATSNTVFTLAGTSTLTTCKSIQSATVTANVCNGIEINNDAIGLRIFPRPCIDIINIESVRDLKGYVFDNEGKIVLTLDVKVGFTNFSMTGVLPGVYVLKLTADNFCSRQKLVKVNN